MMESGALRVLHLSAGNLYGGIETMLRTLAVERLACPAMQPEFALVTEGRLSTELRAAGVPVHMLGAVRVRYPWTVLRARHTLRTLLKKQRYDVAVCHGAWPHGLAAPALRAAAVPFAFFQHGIAEGTHWTERWAKRVAPDVVLANSQFCAGSAKKLFAAAAPVVVYCPIPSPKPMTDEKRAEIRGAVRRELGTADGDVVVLQVSRMEPWKGHRLLLQALARVPAGTPWTLWVAGGAQRKEEEAYVADLHAMSASLGVAPRVRWLGQRSDVPDLMTAADIFCQPNLSPEPFGIVFIEALGHGLPVVTVNMGGAAEIVNSDCGALVSGNADELASALARLIDDPNARRTLGSHGPERARAISDVSRQMASFAKALASITRP